jgi:hypothetical protein
LAVGSLVCRAERPLTKEMMMTPRLIEDEKIVAIYVMRNPDKLGRLGDQFVH